MAQAFPPEIEVVPGAAQGNVHHIRGGVEECCPAQSIIRARCPQLVRRLLKLMVGNGKGLVVGQGNGSRIMAGTAGWRAGTESAATWSKEYARKDFESCEKGKTVEMGVNSYKKRTNLV